MAVPIGAALRARVHAAAAGRCGYCRTSQAYVPWPLEIDHIILRARGGSVADRRGRTSAMGLCLTPQERLLVLLVCTSEAWHGSRLAVLCQLRW